MVRPSDSQRMAFFIHKTSHYSHIIVTYVVYTLYIFLDLDLIKPNKK